MCSRDISQDVRRADQAVTLEVHEDDLDYAVLDRVYGVTTDRPARARDAAAQLAERED